MRESLRKGIGNKMKRTLLLLFSILLSLTVFAGAAGAHVVVYPRETTQGAFEKFTVRVPSEIAENFTVAVELEIPDDVNISRVEPKPGWNYEMILGDAGKVTQIKWTAAGDGLSDSEFTEFNMQGRVRDEAEKIVWKAYQTYADGTVVAWVGDESAAEPASVTAVKAPGADQENEPSAAAPSPWPLVMSAAALVLSLAALVLSLRRKSS